jgi:selenide,water dikinase
LEIPSSPNLIVGLHSLDDAGVYKLTEELAIIQTIDFFTPIVDDPYTFGQVAATNALSDIYAMGGKPITAMNIVCFPSKTMDVSILQEILRGGLDKLKQADVLLVGGHSVDDPEIKFGLSVSGVVHPLKVARNTGAMAGDVLVLTKPLGTGIINTAAKANQASEGIVEKAIEQMATLNKTASEIMQRIGIHACTDVTGFGLLGHASEMIQNGDIGLELYYSTIPTISGTVEFAQNGFIPGGTSRNREYRANTIEFAEDVPEWASDILFDPQTSGGLLMAISDEKAGTYLEELKKANLRQAAIIGKVIEKPKGKILVRM